MGKKILLCFYAGIANSEKDLFCFYESMVNSLTNNGNTILVYSSKFFNANAWNGENNLLSCIDRNLLEEKIKDFNPDLIITFNNSTYGMIDKITSCPILFWAADSINYFSQKSKLINNDRSFFVAPAKITANEYHKFGIKKVTILDGASAIVAENLIQDQNVSFIGSCFDKSGSINEFIDNHPEHKKKMMSVLKVFLEKNNYNMHKLLDNFNAIELLNFFKKEDIINEFFDLRVPTLLSLSDLGLNIYGPIVWKELFVKSLPWIVLAYNKKTVSSLKINQDIYNSSKICLNINHPQSGIAGFSWRVYDIMSSNGCLLTNYNTKLHKIFKTEGIDLPMFNSPYEARELAIKLLNNDNLRADIVSTAQNYIKKNISWNNTIKIISEITGVQLLNKEHGFGKLEFIYQKDCLNKVGSLINKVNVQINKKITLIDIRGFLTKIYYMNIATILKKLNLENKIKKLLNKYL